MEDFDEKKKVKEAEKKEKTVKVKLVDKQQVRHSGKLYKYGDVIEMTKPEMERLAAICKIEEVKE